ncbi:MAG: ABC transporter permease [Actinomycetales bacterium]|nr:ABC transporter permease [Actinomycetales bacterium]
MNESQGGRGAVKRRALLARAVFTGPGLLYVTAFMTIPLVIIAVYSFLNRGRFGGVKFEPTLENYLRAFEPVYLSVFGNSILIALVTTLLALLIGYPAAMAIARLPRRWRTIALVLVVLPFWSNFLIRTYAWIILLNSQGPINSALVGWGILGAPLDLLYNRGAVVVGLLYAYLPLMILPVYASIERLDPQLGEAAANLGAGRFRTFLDVTLPLTLPGVLIGSIFVFVPSLGNFIVPELLGGGKTVMVGNLIRDQFLEARDWPFGAVIALIVVALLVGLFAAQARVSRAINGGSRA